MGLPSLKPANPSADFRPRGYRLFLFLPTAASMRPGNRHPWRGRPHRAGRLRLRRHPWRLVRFPHHAWSSGVRNQVLYLTRVEASRRASGWPSWLTSMFASRPAGQPCGFATLLAVPHTPLDLSLCSTPRSGGMRPEAHRRLRTSASLISGRNSCSRLES